MQVLAILVALATSALGVPLDTGREFGTPRLLREGWRLPDDVNADAFDEPPAVQDGDEVSKGNAGVPPDVDQTVEQAAESRLRPIRVFGRSLTRPPTRQPLPQPPYYRAEEHLAEKPALPPHVLKARSEERARLRSRSRPVQRPLYTSSDHLAERPAIPLPQLEAYESSRGGPGALSPYVEDVEQKETPTEDSAARNKSSKPIPEATTTGPAAEAAAPEEPAELEAVEPSLFGAEKDAIAQTETGPASEVPVISQASSSTTVSTQEKPGGSSEDKLSPSGVSSETSALEGGSVAPTTVTPQSTTDSVRSVSDHSVDPEELQLYSSDNEITRERTKQHSPAPTTTPQFPSTTRAQSPSTTRRRFTFRPFTRTVPPSTTTTTTAAPETPPLYAAGLQVAGVLVPETTRNLLISTEPTIHENENIPEVPQEPDDDAVATTVAVPLATLTIPTTVDRNDSASGYNPSEATSEATGTKEPQPTETVQVPDVLSGSQEHLEQVDDQQATTTKATLPAVESETPLSKIPGEVASAVEDGAQPVKDGEETAVFSEEPSALLNSGPSVTRAKPEDIVTTASVSPVEVTSAKDAVSLSAESSTVPPVSEKREEAVTGPQEGNPTTAAVAVAEDTLQPGQYARGIPSAYLGSRSVDF